MARSPTVYVLPPNTVPKVPLEVISSAQWNAAMNDIAQTFNTIQPIQYGGNGVSDNKPLTNSFGLRDSTDLTKLGIFSATDIPTATTLTYTLPSTSGTLALTSQVSGLASKVDTRRNRIVNGDKLVSQENGQTSGTTNGRYISDQNAMYFVSSAGVFTGVNVQTLSPAGGYRDRITITTPDASLAAGEYLTYTQNIEGSNVRDAKWGTAGAVPIIVRRGFRFPAGTYTVAFHNSAVNRSYVTSFVVSGGEANTDIVREFAIPGDTTGTWLNADGVIGLTMDVVIAAGTTYQGVAGWQAGNLLTIAGTTNGIASGGAVYEFFDEGLRLDPDATGSYGVYEVVYNDSLYNADRYYEAILIPSDTAIATAHCTSVTTLRWSLHFKEKCKIPTIAVPTTVTGLDATGGIAATTLTNTPQNPSSYGYSLINTVLNNGVLGVGDASLVYAISASKLVISARL